MFKWALLFVSVFVLTGSAAAEDKMVPLTPPAVTVESAKTDSNPKSTMDEMKEAMHQQMQRQNQIRMLTLGLEELRLRKETAVAENEISSIKKSSQNSVSDVVNIGSGDQKLDLKLLFLSCTDKSKEAIITVNGQNFVVKEGDKPKSNLLVKSITTNNVVVKVNDSSEITLTLNYLE